jgi:hypothetical protein
VIARTQRLAASTSRQSSVSVQGRPPAHPPALTTGPINGALSNFFWSTTQPLRETSADPERSRANETAFLRYISYMDRANLRARRPDRPPNRRMAILEQTRRLATTLFPRSRVGTPLLDAPRHSHSSTFSRSSSAPPASFLVPRRRLGRPTRSAPYTGVRMLEKTSILGLVQSQVTRD